MNAVDATQTDGDWRIYPELPIRPILAAALNHFQRSGYHGTTVRNIASEVGLTMPTLYYHYGNKEGILFALLDIAMDDFWAHADAALEEAGDDTAARFRNFVTSVALHYTNRRDLAVLHDEFRFLGPEFREKYLLRRDLVGEVLEGLVKDGVAEGIFDVDSPDLTSLAILGMLGGILDWFRVDGPLTAESVAERYASYAHRMVTPLTT